MKEVSEEELVSQTAVLVYRQFTLLELITLLIGHLID
jgi:hypothetical protein